MKFGVVIFPGSNCDHDMVYVLKEVLGQEPVEIWHKESSLPAGFGAGDCIILPGGFSFGDYLRSGAIARFSPVMQAVIDFANAGGFVFGVCNGFQVLCESGLLPGALLRNNHQKFHCKNVYLKVESTESPLTAHLDKEYPLMIPVAHADGRYYADDQTLDGLFANGQVLFQYCDENGAVTPEANPNGSARNIAGICNAGRNVFGMMPHPERAAIDVLGNTDGRLLFESLLRQATGA